jgi:hypothetical protein
MGAAVSKFFSYPGSSPRGSDGPKPRRLPENWREHPQVREYFASRSPTSHSVTGFDPGEQQFFRGDVARVEGEEKNQHTGAIEQWVQRSDSIGSGTYVNRWEPIGPRSMQITDTRRVHE